jgi:hypothetical protein
MHGGATGGCEFEVLDGLLRAALQLALEQTLFQAESWRAARGDFAGLASRHSMLLVKVQLLRYR